MYSVSLPNAARASAAAVRKVSSISLLVPHELDAAAAAAGRGFEQQRITNLFGEQRGFMGVARMIRTRHQRDAGAAGDFTRFELVAHHRDVVGAGSDEGDFIIDASLGKRRPL